MSARRTSRTSSRSRWIRSWTSPRWTSWWCWFRRRTGPRHRDRGRLQDGARLLRRRGRPGDDRLVGHGRRRQGRSRPRDPRGGRPAPRVDLRGDRRVLRRLPARRGEPRHARRQLPAALPRGLLDRALRRDHRSGPRPCPARVDRRRDRPLRVRRARSPRDARRIRFRPGGGACSAGADLAEPAAHRPGVRPRPAPLRARRPPPDQGRRVRLMASITRIPPRTRFMPRDPRVEEPYRMTPAIALRLGVLGAIVLFAFAVLFFRLWALQVLAGDQYLAAAQDNQLRTVRIDAARGPILDYKGRLLVSNRIGTAAQVWTAYMPRRGRERMLRRLSAILIVPVPELRRLLREHKGDPLTPVTLKEDLSQEEIFYLKEHRRDFPGLELNDIHLRDYRYGSLAPQILGHVGDVTEDQLKAGRYRHGDTVGQAGLEFSYDRFLRGTAGPAALEAVAKRAAAAGARVADDARRKASARCRGRPRVRHPGRPREQELVCECRRRSRDRPAHWSDPRDGDQPHVRPAGLRGQGEAGEAPVADRPQGCRAGQLPRPEPRDVRLLPAGLDVQAGHCPRCDARAAGGAVRAAVLHGEDGDRRDDLPELEPVRERGDGPADRARRLVRHLLLPTGSRVLRAPTGVRQPAPEMGLGVRVRQGDRARRGR